MDLIALAKMIQDGFGKVNERLDTVQKDISEIKVRLTFLENDNGRFLFNH